MHYFELVIYLRTLIHLLELVVFSLGVVFAEPVYFNPIPQTYMLTNETVAHLKLNYDIVGAENSRFKIRPVISDGKISIFKKETSEWIEGNDTWLALPKLDKELSVKPIVLSEPESDLHFLIQDSVTSKIYETPKIHFWTNLLYKSYLQKLNDQINSYYGILVE